MKIISFLFHHKSNNFLSLCALLLFLSSPITLYATEENTVIIEESPATLENTADVSEEISNEIPQTEVAIVESTQETITIETPSMDTSTNPLPSQDATLPNIQNPAVNDFTVESFDGTYYVISSGGLNVRKGPSTNYDVIGSLSYGKEIRVTGKVGSDWFEISYQGTTGYISSKYVSLEPVATSPLYTEQQTAATTEPASEEANTNHDITPFLSNAPMLLVLLAIIVVIILIIITVFSFFRNNTKYDSEDYDEYDDYSYDDSDEHDDYSYDDSDEYDDGPYDSKPNK